jgi:hypothetical protein
MCTGICTRTHALTHTHTYRRTDTGTGKRKNYFFKGKNAESTFLVPFSSTKCHC